MSTTDWNTVTSDLQRAANNLAWFVLESMTIPGQPPSFMPLPTVLASSTVSLETSKEALVDLPRDENNVFVDNAANLSKKKKMKPPLQQKRLAKTSIGKAVDRLVSETLV